MPSRVTIFQNSTGVAIAELSTSTTRSWLLDGVGRCQFRLPTFTDPNVAREILQYGNLVLVQHIPTMDEAGNRRGQLPDWVGVIFPPQEWEYGLLTVTAYTAEQLLFYKPMPYVSLHGAPGAIAQQIARLANSFGGYPVQLGQIFLGGASTIADVRLSALEELANLAKAHADDFDVTASIANGNRLNLLLNWYSQRGQVVHNSFNEGIGGNMKLPKLAEQGSIVNSTRGYNISNDPTTRLSARADDTDSEADYGKLGQNQNFNVNGQAAVNAATTSYNNLHARPSITLDLTALDVGKTFDDIDLGNIWSVQLKSVGFFAGSIGFQASVRLSGFEYDDQTNEVILATKVLTAKLTEANYA